jgi:hypothetical protein
MHRCQASFGPLGPGILCMTCQMWVVPTLFVCTSSYLIHACACTLTRTHAAAPLSHTIPCARMHATDGAMKGGRGPGAEYVRMSTPALRVKARATRTSAGRCRMLALVLLLLRPPCFVRSGSPTTLSPTHFPTAAPTRAPTGAPTAAPTIAPTAVITAVYAPTLTGNFCSALGIRLGGVGDYLTLTPAFTPSADHTVVFRLNFSSHAGEQRIFDFSETTDCSGGHYYVHAKGEELKINLDGGCGSFTFNHFW